MKTLYLVRYGETDGDTLDPALTRNGIEQANTCATVIYDQCRDLDKNIKIFTSPEVNTCQMANIFNKILNTHSILDDRLLPLNRGVFNGRNSSRNTLCKNAIDEYDSLKNHIDPYTLRYPYGESVSDVSIRIASLMDKIMLLANQEIIVIISDLLILRVILANVCNSDRGMILNGEHTITCGGFFKLDIENDTVTLCANNMVAKEI